jgi:hypothetical protein
MAVYLYAPPSYEQHAIMHKALRYHTTVSTTVYRIGGVWHNVLTPGQGAPDPAACDVIRPNTSTALRLYFNKPMVIPDDIHDELAALQPADPSWTPGVLTLL